jgi:hypothetical protein
MYKLVLKNLKVEGERIVLAEATTEQHAEQQRRNWRRALGGTRWTVNRRPGLDTLDHLGLAIEKT